MFKTRYNKITNIGHMFKINNKENWLGENLLGEILTELRDELSK